MSIRNSPTYWIACLFTSIGYGRKRSSADVILASTQKAMVGLEDTLRFIKRGGNKVGDIWAVRLNSGKFGVNWERTKSVLEGCGMNLKVVNPAEKGKQSWYSWLFFHQFIKFQDPRGIYKVVSRVNLQNRSMQVRRLAASPMLLETVHYRLKHWSAREGSMQIRKLAASPMYLETLQSLLEHWSAREAPEYDVNRKQGAKHEGAKDSTDHALYCCSYRSENGMIRESQSTNVR